MARLTSEEADARRGRRGVRVKIAGETDFETLKARLIEKLTSSPNFFHGCGVTVDIGRCALSSQELLELENLLHTRYGARMVEIVRGGGEAPAPARGAGREEGPAADQRPTWLVRRTLRSGQRLVYPGNIVLLGDVNPGAEVVAGGDIVVMGALRGVAHAGAYGDEGAMVAAIRLRPTQLRIGGLISRPPEGEEPPDLPEVARVRDGRVVIEPYQPAP